MQIADPNTPPYEAGRRTPDDPTLIDGRRFAELLDVSAATFSRLKAAGRLPPHIALSRGCHRWRLADARSWIEAGCPAIKEWEARRRLVTHGLQKRGVAASIE
jgi:predicted DNA-binding transcriptional regulator AlpA